MSFYNLPHPWDPGYEIPDYVMAEPMGRGTFTTAWLPRGTVSTLPPDYLAKRVGEGGEMTLGSLGGSSLGGHSLEGDTLAAYRLAPLGQNGGDAITAFGRKAAAVVMQGMARVPASERQAYLRRVLRAIDSRLVGELGPAVRRAKSRGIGGAAATQHALAEVLSQGFKREIVELGTRGRRRGLLGFAPLGETGSSSEPWDFRNITRDHRKQANMFHTPKFQAAWQHAMNRAKGGEKAAIKRGDAPFATFENLSHGGEKWGIYWDGKLLSVKPVPPPKKRGFWDRVWGFIKSVGKGFTAAIRGVGRAAKDTLNTVKDLACGLAKSEVGTMAGAGAAAAYGAPPQVGAAGASAAASMCGGKPEEQPPPNLPPSGGGLPGWVLPAAIGGGALLLAVAFRR